MNLLDELKKRIAMGDAVYSLAEYISKRFKIDINLAQKYMRALSKIGCFDSCDEKEDHQGKAFQTIKFLSEREYPYDAIAQAIAERHRCTTKLAKEYMDILINLGIISFLECDKKSLLINQKPEWEKKKKEEKPLSPAERKFMEGMAPPVIPTRIFVDGKEQKSNNKKATK